MAGLLLLSIFVSLVACGDEDISEGPYCGNGIVDTEEECDDGNNIDGDGCSADCRIEREPDACEGAADGEACDEGKVCLDGACIVPGCLSNEDCEVSENVCIGDSVCDLASFECVEGEILVGEECGEASVCNDEGACVVSICGNGQLEFGESCDDGNADAGDGCSSRCRIETSFRVSQMTLVDPHVFVMNNFSVEEGKLVPSGDCVDFTHDERELNIEGVTPAALPVPSANSLIEYALSEVGDRIRLSPS